MPSTFTTPITASTQRQWSDLAILRTFPTLLGARPRSRHATWKPAVSAKAPLGDIRTELRAMRADVAAVDRQPERDFRITFGAIITTIRGLAFLIAGTAHWP